ncbi:hypothetical protein PM082_014381 [Marasmius tenuissimus]|nr:hypothetical protein PM082_014381 [Marasmius tenuissimus]
MYERVKTFEVGEYVAEWSDHAPLHVEFDCRVDTEATAMAYTASNKSTKRKADGSLREKRPLPSESELDRMYIEVINSVPKTKDNPMVAMFGYLLLSDSQDESPVQLYTSAVCDGLGTISVKAGAGIYGGPSSRYNKQFRVPGPALSLNRGHLFAIYCTLKMVSLSKPMLVISSSEYAISALTVYIGFHNKNHWNCANGDLLKAIVQIIRLRSASLHLSLQVPQGRNGNEAEQLAQGGLEDELTIHVPNVARIHPSGEVVPEGCCRVTTDYVVPDQVAQKTVPQGGGSEDLASHRNRSRVLRQQDQNLTEFRESSVSPKKFWDTFRKFAGKAAEETGLVTANGLMEVFKLRMNTREIHPSFDIPQYKLNEAVSNSIPEVSTDKTSDQIFESDFNVDEVELAKEELQ